MTRFPSRPIRAFPKNARETAVVGIVASDTGPKIDIAIHARHGERLAAMPSRRLSGSREFMKQLADAINAALVQTGGAP